MIIIIIQKKVIELKDGDVTLSTSLFMFHLISFSPHFIDHVSFLFPSAQSPSHSFHLPQTISFIFTLFGCIHITWPFNHFVSFTFQPIPSLEMNNLPVSLDKFLILDKYSLLEAELLWFYYSLSLYIKQEIKHCARILIAIGSFWFLPQKRAQTDDL